MKQNQILLSLPFSFLSGLLLGLSVNHGYNLAFLLPVCMLGIFYALEKQTGIRGWILQGWMFSVTALSLALIGFAWVEPLAGTLMILIGAAVFTLPFLVLSAIHYRLNLSSIHTFVLLALLWPPFTWFIKERLIAFPITLFDISLSNYPVFIQFIDITGPTGVSTWVIILNLFIFLLIKAIFSKQETTETLKQPLSFLVLGLMMWISVPLLYAWYSYSVLPTSFKGTIKAAVIQHGFPDPSLSEDKITDALLSTALKLTDSAIVHSKPDLVVWPEGELPFAIRTETDALRFIADRVLRWQTPLITGIVDTEPTPFPTPPLQAYLGRDYFQYNAVAMITPQLSWKILMEDARVSMLKVYRKVNLMPFTEYVPLSSHWPWLSTFGLNYGENTHLSPGKPSPTMAFLTLDGRIVRTIPTICWDILFASTHGVDQLKNAHLITAHSSGRLFGKDLKTSLLGMKNYTRLRSVEARRSIVNSSTTGYSYFANPFGEVLGLIDPFVEGYSVHDIPLHQNLTFYSRYPNLYPSLCLGLILGFIFFLRKPKK